jgi:hypothetical protein
MGISVTFPEDYILDSGIGVNNVYASFRLDSPKIHKLTNVDLPGGGYRIDGKLYFWVTKDAADQGRASFMNRPYGFDVPEMPTVNLYQFLYEKIREWESSWTIEDVIDSTTAESNTTPESTTV